MREDDDDQGHRVVRPRDELRHQVNRYTEVRTSNVIWTTRTKEGRAVRRSGAYNSGTTRRAAGASAAAGWVPVLEHEEQGRTIRRKNVMNVLQQEADLTAGHGILRATGLIAISADQPQELERAVAVIEQAAIQASGETRRLWGQQAQAFAAAALPLCRQV